MGHGSVESDAWRCPTCDAPTVVGETRATTHAGRPAVRRRRLCKKGCPWRFSTIEVQVPEGRRVIQLEAALRRLEVAVAAVRESWPDFIDSVGDSVSDVDGEEGP